MAFMIGAGVTATEGPAPSPSSTGSNVSAEAPVPAPSKAAGAPEGSVRQTPVPAPEKTSLEHSQGTVIASTTLSSVLGCHKGGSLHMVGASAHQAQSLASTTCQQIHCC